MAKVEISLNQVNPATMAVIDGTAPLRMVAATPALSIELSIALRGQRGEQGIQGEQGIPGAPGASGDISFIYQAAMAISGHRIVTLNEQGMAIYASSALATHANRIVGLTTNAASPGDGLNVKKFGEVTEPSWNWQIENPVYLGNDGVLTQIPPEAPDSKFSVVIGFPISATTLFINIGIPITLIA